MFVTITYGKSDQHESAKPLKWPDRLILMNISFQLDIALFDPNFFNLCGGLLNLNS